MPDCCAIASRVWLTLTHETMTKLFGTCWLVVKFALGTILMYAQPVQSTGEGLRVEGREASPKTLKLQPKNDFKLQFKIITQRKLLLAGKYSWIDVLGYRGIPRPGWNVSRFSRTIPRWENIQPPCSTQLRSPHFRKWCVQLSQKHQPCPVYCCVQGSWHSCNCLNSC